MDFIKKKILLRTIFASIAPVTLYSIGFGLYKLFSFTGYNATMKYFNMIPWIVIGIISALYPVNYIGLWLLFAPIEGLVNKKLL